MFVLASKLGAAHTKGDSSVYLVRHVGPIVFLSRRVAHTCLSKMSGYRRMMCEVKDA